jgi:DNA-binding MarR family transcriptional regulator
MSTIEEEIQTEKFRNPFHKLAVNLIFTGNWVMDSQTLSVLKPYDLSVEQYNVLRILRGQYPKPITVNGITERMMNRMSNVSRLVDKLVQKGYVSRCIATHDRRAVDVRISNEGLELLYQLDIPQNYWLDTFAKLTEGEAETLSLLLDKMRG